MAQAPVTAFVIEAIQTTVSGAIGAPLLTSRVPNPASKIVPLASAAAATTPGIAPDSVGSRKADAIRWVFMIIPPYEPRIWSKNPSGLFATGRSKSVTHSNLLG
jgi:hypothetical protein